MHIKNVARTSLKAYSSPTGSFVAGERCWNVDGKADIALPCATQVNSWGPAARAMQMLLAMVVEVNGSGCAAGRSFWWCC